MSNDPVIYRSTAPEALDHYQGVLDTIAVVRQRREDFIAELGMPGRKIAQMGGGAGYKMTGVQHLPEHGDIPTGWKLDRDLSGCIKPDTRTAPGRRIAKRMEELTLPTARKDLPGGMPEMVWDMEGGPMARPGVQRMEGAVYVRWPFDPEQADKGLKIDPEVWERVKLSDYYAVVERNENAEEDK